MEHFIRVYDRVIAPEVCEAVIERFETSREKFAGLVLGKEGRKVVDRSHKRTTELVISDDPAWADLETHMQAGYVQCINAYAEEFPHIGDMVGQLYSEPFRLKKYGRDDFFDWHVDSAGENSSRVVAIQFYFNDVQEGGATEFRFQKLRVAAVRGRVIVFPTLWTYLHRGAPVRSNPKYICTNYVRSEPATARAGDPAPEAQERS